jgi:hypothetical protein
MGSQITRQANWQLIYIAMVNCVEDYLKCKHHSAVLNVEGVVTHVKPTYKVDSVVTRNHNVVLPSTVEMVVVQILIGTNLVTTFAHHSYGGLGIIFQIVSMIIFRILIYISNFNSFS